MHKKEGLPALFDEQIDVTLRVFSVFNWLVPAGMLHVFRASKASNGIGSV